MPFAMESRVESGCFRGDAPQLLDRLIEACQTSTSPKHMEGYGRELLPWCPDADVPMLLDQPLEATTVRTRRSPDYKKSSAHGATAAHKRPRASSSPARRCSLDAAQGAFACPSFAAAPKPEALPMPTSSLLTRCRRSPSPPKNMAAMVMA